MAELRLAQLCEHGNAKRHLTHVEGWAVHCPGGRSLSASEALRLILDEYNPWCSCEGEHTDELLACGECESCQPGLEDFCCIEPLQCGAMWPWLVAAVAEAERGET